MSNGSQAAIDAIAAIIKEMKLKQELTEIYYRIDYEDYQVLFGETHHCEIQEKTINDVLEFKNADAKRQIHFLLNHLTAYEEWEKQGKAAAPEEKMQLDDES